jgi:putative transposase
MKAYKYKLRPSPALKHKFAVTLECCRELYNAALAERRAAWRMAGHSITYLQQANQLPEIKVLREDLGAVHSQVLQDTLRRLQKSFDGFFLRLKRGERAGYPCFKGRSHYDSFTYPQRGYRIIGNKLHLSKLGSCRLHLSRPIEGEIKTCTIKREADGWYVIFVVEPNQSRYLPRTKQEIGVDLGIVNFAALSNGDKVRNPRYLRRSEAKLKTAQQRVSRRPNKASRRRREAVKLLAKHHLKVRRQRQHFHHTTALELIEKYDRLTIEDLNIAGMLKEHHLAKSISDAGWGTFIKILTDKAAEAGREVDKVAPEFTSQDCSGCGQRVRKSLAMREHRCIACGLVIDRDVNAAINIKNKAGARPALKRGNPRVKRKPPIL